MAEEIRLRELSEADIELIAFWLQKEHVIKWYHDAEAWLQEIRGRRSDFSWINHYIVLDGGAPIGFCQYYDCYDARELEGWYTVEKRGETFSIDYFIGEESYLGKGCGKAIVRLITDKVRSREKARRIIVKPEDENRASIGALIANVYVFDKQLGYYVKLLD